MTILQRTISLGFLLVTWSSFLALPAFGQDVDGSKDHPLLSRFPGSSIVGYQQQTHDQTFIPTEADLQAGDWVAGKSTWIAYRAPSNASVLQLYRNYEKALTDAGFVNAYACRKDDCGSNFVRNMLRATGRYIGRSDKWMPGTVSYLAAKLPAETGEIWVSLMIHELNQQGLPIVRQEIIEVNSARSIDSLPARNDGKKSVEYDEIKIAAGKSDNNRLSSVLELEGKVDWNVLRYGADVSAYEVFASWAKYATDNEFEFEFSCGRQSCGSRFIKRVIDLNGLLAEGGEKWSQNSGYYFLAKSTRSGKSTRLGLLSYKQPNGVAVSHSITVVSDIPDFDKITVNAQSLAAEIEEKGKVAVYGIYFDTDEAVVKPESMQMLEEISKLLELRPQLSLFVDGHTDDQGADDYNLDLSQRRAAAVVDALGTSHGVDTTRLEARGFGEGAPIETNDVAGGRAKNRRVELVAK